MGTAGLRPGAEPNSRKTALKRLLLFWRTFHLACPQITPSPLRTGDGVIRVCTCPCKWLSCGRPGLLVACSRAGVSRCPEAALAASECHLIPPKLKLLTGLLPKEVLCLKWSKFGGDIHSASSMIIHILCFPPIFALIFAKPGLV